VDPGGTTGVALVSFEGRYRLEVHGGMTGTAAEVAHDVHSLTYAGITPIAAERFVVSRRAGRSNSAHAGEKARTILGALLTSGDTVHLETASAVKAWATDRRLKAAGLAPTDGLPHSRDACRHALYALVKHYGCPDPLSANYPAKDQTR
jgi:hypothetical protein